MRKRVLNVILVFLFFMCNICAGNAANENDVWDDLVNAIAHVESRHNTKAVSSCGTYVGFLQISKPVVDECNRIIGKRKYTYKHRYNKESSVEMFYIIQSYYNPENNIEKAIRIWNGGPNFSKRKTERYYNKVIKVYNVIAAS